MAENPDLGLANLTTKEKFRVALASLHQLSLGSILGADVFLGHSLQS